MVLGLSGIDHHDHKAENDKEEEHQNSDAAASSHVRFILFHFLHFSSPSAFVQKRGGSPAGARIVDAIIRASSKHCQPEIPQTYGLKKIDTTPSLS
jgi:hypothetical protein